MRRHDSLWRAMKDAIVGDPLRKQRDRLEDAIKEHARLVGEAEQQRDLLDFYTREIERTNPHKDWHRFADLKDKEAETHRTWCDTAQKRDDAKVRVHNVRMTLTALEDNNDTAAVADFPHHATRFLARQEVRAGEARILANLIAASPGHAGIAAGR